MTFAAENKSALAIVMILIPLKSWKEFVAGHHLPVMRLHSEEPPPRACRRRSLRLDSPGNTLTATLKIGYKMPEFCRVIAFICD